MPHHACRAPSVPPSPPPNFNPTRLSPVRVSGPKPVALSPPPPSASVAGFLSNWSETPATRLEAIAERAAAAAAASVRDQVLGQVVDELAAAKESMQARASERSAASDPSTAQVLQRLAESVADMHQRVDSTERQAQLDSDARGEFDARLTGTETQVRLLTQGLAEVAESTAAIAGRLEKTAVQSQSQQTSEVLARTLEDMSGRLRALEWRAQRPESDWPPSDSRRAAVTPPRRPSQPDEAGRAAAAAAESERRCKAAAEAALRAAEAADRPSGALDSLTQRVLALERRQPETPTSRPVRSSAAEQRIAAVEHAAKGLLSKVGDTASALQRVEELRERVSEFEAQMREVSDQCAEQSTVTRSEVEALGVQLAQIRGQASREAKATAATAAEQAEGAAWRAELGQRVAALEDEAASVLPRVLGEARGLVTGLDRRLLAVETAPPPVDSAREVVAEVAGRVSALERRSAAAEEGFGPLDERLSAIETSYESTRLRLSGVSPVVDAVRLQLDDMNRHLHSVDAVQQDTKRAVDDINRHLHSVDAVQQDMKKAVTRCVPVDTLNQELSSIRNEVADAVTCAQRSNDGGAAATARVSAVEEHLSGVMLAQAEQHAAVAARVASLEQRTRKAEERLSDADTYAASVHETTVVCEDRLEKLEQMQRSVTDQIKEAGRRLRSVEDQCKETTVRMMSPPPSPPHLAVAERVASLSSEVKALSARVADAHAAASDVNNAHTDVIQAFEQRLLQQERHRQAHDEKVTGALRRTEELCVGLTTRMADQEAAAARQAHSERAAAARADTAHAATQDAIKTCLSRVTAVEQMAGQTAAGQVVAGEAAACQERDMCASIADLQRRVGECAREQREVAAARQALEAEVGELRVRVAARETEAVQHTADIRDASATASGMRREIRDVSSDVLQLREDTAARLARLERAAAVAAAEADAVLDEDDRRWQGAEGAVARVQETADSASQAAREAALGLRSAQKVLSRTVSRQEEQGERIAAHEAELAAVRGRLQQLQQQQHRPPAGDLHLEVREHRQHVDATVDAMRGQLAGAMSAVAALERRPHLAHPRRRSSTSPDGARRGVSPAREPASASREGAARRLAAELRARTRALSAVEAAAVVSSPL
eukprot:TRINITY_DN4759_c0_g3_i1.p1 TRINITY_DN4759_c0_g3~~TRINITY_DN4759_c0_g3_i1.p1  ORF type:complete len:1126 (+),score=276.86 TRINITY_DN4759_c0_g3_i1:70-3447(+)